jgi:hypothetical protein
VAVAAPVFKLDEAGLRERLRQGGVEAPARARSLADVARASGQEPMKLLALAVQPPAAKP